MEKKYVSLTRLSSFLTKLKGIFAPLNHTHTIDSALSSTSTNPVQNKVIDAEFEAIATALAVYEDSLDSHNHDDDYDKKGSASTVQTNLNTVSDTLNSHTGDNDIHVTTTNKTQWNDAYEHSQTGHARADATKTQKSPSNGNLFINDDECTIYEHPDSGVTAGIYKSVTVNAQGHVTAGSNPTTLSGFGITNAYTKTEIDTKVDTLNEALSGKAPASHNHIIADVTNLQAALDNKAAVDHTHDAITNDEIDEICGGTMTTYLNSMSARGVSF